MQLPSTALGVPRRNFCAEYVHSARGRTKIATKKAEFDLVGMSAAAGTKPGNLAYCSQGGLETTTFHPDTLSHGDTARTDGKTTILFSRANRKQPVRDHRTRTTSANLASRGWRDISRHGCIIEGLHVLIGRLRLGLAQGASTWHFGTANTCMSYSADVLLRTIKSHN